MFNSAKNFEETIKLVLPLMDKSAYSDSEQLRIELDLTLNIARKMKE